SAAFGAAFSQVTGVLRGTRPHSDAGSVAAVRTGLIAEVILGRVFATRGIVGAGSGPAGGGLLGAAGGVLVGRGCSAPAAWRPLLRRRGSPGAAPPPGQPRRGGGHRGDQQERQQPAEDRQQEPGNVHQSLPAPLETAEKPDVVVFRLLHVG